MMGKREREKEIPWIKYPEFAGGNGEEQRETESVSYATDFFIL